MIEHRHEQIAARIARTETFSTTTTDHSLKLNLTHYQPVMAIAVDGGTQLRRTMARNLALEESLRAEVEKPLSNSLVEQFPLSLTGLDSPLEYDLDRPAATCIPRMMGDLEIWREPPHWDDILLSRNKHRDFYRILIRLAKTLERMYGHCVIHLMTAHIDPLIGEAPQALVSNHHEHNGHADVIRWHAQLQLLNNGKMTVHDQSMPEDSYFFNCLTSRLSRTVVIKTTIKIANDRLLQNLQSQLADAMMANWKRANRDQVDDPPQSTFSIAN